MTFDDATPESRVIGAEPIVIVGSHLQALIYGVSAFAIGWGLFDSLGWVALVLSVVLLALAGVVLARRAVLEHDGLEIRKVRGTRSARNGSFRATTGHRYLTIRFDDGSTSRIEVPVEVRPNVRNWAEAANGFHPGL